MYLRFHAFTFTLLSGILSGCHNSPSNPIPKQSWPIEVEEKIERISLVFKPHTSRLSAASMAKVQDFIKRYGGQKPTTRLTAVQTPLNTKRLAYLTASLHRQGIEEVKQQAIKYGARPAINTILLEIVHYKVRPPQCPGWGEAIGPGAPLEGERNFGCTTQANLAHMIADPRDLINPQTGASDAQRQIRAINDYYEGKQKALKVEKVSAEKS